MASKIVIWYLIVITNSGMFFSFPQKSHETCLKTQAQTVLEPEVQIAVCSTTNHYDGYKNG